MKMTRIAGIPASVVLACGEDPSHDFPIAILMTSLTCRELNDLLESRGANGSMSWVGVSELFARGNARSIRASALY